ncbi:MAG: pre-rRNA processing protein [Alyxoria varia]|nr:MAG: pre-rRNA processing protein [Alyxoria varia]
MSSFFTLPASQKKRKRQEAPASTKAFKKRNTGGAARSKESGNTQNRKTREKDDESISGSSESGSENEAKAGDQESTDEPSDSDVSGSDAAQDPEAARRLKLAERYLDNVRNDVAAEADVEGFHAEDVERDLISRRLKEDVAENKGRIYRKIADELDYERARKTFFGADTEATSGVAVCPPYVYTVSAKDKTLIKWELHPHQWGSAAAAVGKDGKEMHQRTRPKQLLYTRGNKKKKKGDSSIHHTGAILCVVASADGKFVATGGHDKKLILWDATNLKPIKMFHQHRDAVTALAFQGKTNQLFSASKDRTIKIWSMNEHAYVETLFGHQDEVLDVAAVGGPEERCVSVGARDRSARLWKVVDESQLVFRGGSGGGEKLQKKMKNNKAEGIGQEDSESPVYLEGSLDRVIQIDFHLFVTGSDNGSLSLYGLHKKKALHILPFAHGLDPPLPVEESYAEADLTRKRTAAQATPRWITALASIPFSDLFVSGSWDGYVRAWKISDDQKRIESVGVLGQMKDIANGTFQAAGLRGIGGEDPARIKGSINDLAVFERGQRGSQGACVIAAVGTHPRNGRWMEIKGKNGAFVFEIPKSPAPKARADSSETVNGASD